ncbi:MAG: hypothetical protein A2776_02410 [Candidatus Levybacteria bacterium RIFCSPHIGHO2_01_FULL_40_10]|nr:MAG: hypothetical protein A2776_02410 [Candidatus Levybacteria bacterium RIFCSPHIGHO2_01_FULL_40_10]
MQEEKSKLEEFFSEFRRITYKKRELIIRADETPSGLYFIYKGFVRLYSISESGQELTLIIFKPKDLFPIRWAVVNGSPYYCEAITSVEVAKAPRDKFLEFSEKNPEVLSELLTKVLTRLGGLLERMEYSVFGNAYQKVASILVICAERFGREKDGEIVIRVPLTHKDLANLVGLTRETTSVELKKLEKLGLCEKEGSRFLIKNLKKLKDEANWYKFE